MKVGHVDTDQQVLIIAEVGNNHEGDVELAKAMVCSVAEAGADAVKFQTIVPERLVSGDQPERLAQLNRFQLDYDHFVELKQVADAVGVLFLSTPFDIESARFLDGLVPAFKIASGDNDFFPLLDTVARTGKPLIVSAGLAGLDGISRTADFVRDVWERHGIEGALAVLHCVASYPTPPEAASLASIEALKELDAVVGYSDHTLGIEAAVLSVAAGARVVEKHFTFNKAHSDFRDHQLSADPVEMAELVRRIREATTLMGAGSETRTDVEAANLIPVRRSIAARRDLEPGETIRYEDLTWLRPGNGFRPGEEDAVVGRSVVRTIAAGHLIWPDDLAPIGAS